MQISEHALLLQVLGKMMPLIKAKEEGKSVIFPRDHDYNYRVFWYLKNLVSTFERLNMCQIFITDFKNPKLYSIKGIYQYDWVQYHNQMYIVSAWSIYDTALRLTDAVFGLGLQKKNIKQTTVENNVAVKSTDVYQSLVSLRTAISGYRNARNEFCHSGELENIDELSELEIYCVAHKSHIEQIPDVSLLRSNYKKTIQQFSAELTNETNIYFNNVISLLDNLLPVYRCQLSKF